MKKAFAIVGLMLVSVCGVLGQEVVQTSTLEGSRFEMIQSPLDKTVAFRLDKFTGTIDRLGTCPKDDGFGSNKCWKDSISDCHQWPLETYDADADRYGPDVAVGGGSTGPMVPVHRLHRQIERGLPVAALKTTCVGR